jgi:hypothetical protein
MSLLSEPERVAAAALCVGWDDADTRAALAAACNDATARAAAAAEALSSLDGPTRCAAAVARAVGALRLDCSSAADAELHALASRCREAEPARRALVEALLRHLQPRGGPRLGRLQAGHASALRAMLLSMQAAADTSDTLRGRCFAALVWLLALEEPRGDARATAAALQEWRATSGRVRGAAPPLWAVQWAQLPQDALPQLSFALFDAFCDKSPKLHSILATVPSAPAVRQACCALGEPERAAAAAALNKMADFAASLASSAPELARASSEAFHLLFAAAASAPLLAAPEVASAFESLMALNKRAALLPGAGLLQVIMCPSKPSAAADALLQPNSPSLWPAVAWHAPGLITPGLLSELLANQNQPSTHRAAAIRWTALARCSAAVQALASAAFLTEVTAAVEASDASAAAVALRRVASLPQCSDAVQSAVSQLAQRCARSAADGIAETATARRDIMAAALAAAARLDGGGGGAIVLEALRVREAAAAAVAQVGACVRRGLPACDAVSALAALLSGDDLGVAAAKGALLALHPLPGSDAVILQFAGSRRGMHGDVRLTLLPLLWHIAARGADGALDFLERAARTAAAAADNSTEAPASLQSAQALLSLPRAAAQDAMCAYARRILLPLLGSAEARLRVAAAERVASPLYSPRDERPLRAVTDALCSAVASVTVGESGAAPRSAAAVALAISLGDASADAQDAAALAATVAQLCTAAGGANGVPSLRALRTLLSTLAQRTPGCWAAATAVSAAMSPHAWTASIRIEALLRTAPSAVAAAEALGALHGSCWHGGSLRASLETLPSLLNAFGAHSVCAAFSAAARRVAAAPFFLRIALAALCAEARSNWTAERVAMLHDIQQTAARAVGSTDNAAGLAEALMWAILAGE